jgi:hypothetical protein
MQSPILSVVTKISQSPVTRNVLQSLLLTTLMLGVMEVPVHAQVVPGEMQAEMMQPDRTIKVRLKRSGVDDEWVRVEISNDAAGETLRAYHTTRVKQRLLSTLITGVANFGSEALVSELTDGYDGPVPVPDINFHRWADHPTQHLTFVPEGCDAEISDRQSICAIRGTDTLRLPVGTEIQAGQLTIEYLEESLVRSVTLIIPSE